VPVDDALELLKQVAAALEAVLNRHRIFLAEAVLYDGLDVLETGGH